MGQDIRSNRRGDLAKPRPKYEVASVVATDRVEVLGVRVDALDAAGLSRRVAGLVRAGAPGTRPSLVLNVNAHGLNLVRRERGLRGFFESAEIVFADGFGVVLAARLAGEYLPGRITYADWAYDLAALSEHEGFSVYLLGGRPKIAELAAEKLMEEYPKLDVCGTHHGYFDRVKESAENRAVVAEINAKSPDVLLVGMGMPAQERWLMENHNDLDSRVALSCGGALDYVSGSLKRGPKLLTDNGFEWLARLAIEPGRLWKRYLIGNPAFIVRAVLDALRKRLHGS